MDFLIALAALCFLMFVAYRGFSVILFAPIAALGAVFLTDPHAVPAAFTGLFMEKMVAFAKLYFPVFLLGAVFAAYPFAAELFRAGDIPKRLIPGTIAVGAFSFTMDSLPFSPQIQNIIPTTYFKTNTGAAPILGIVGAIFILICGISYLEWQ